MNRRWLRQTLDLIAPRFCPICDRRLCACEDVVCAGCNFNLPRTYLWKDPYDNAMARLFWGVFPIERCAAYLYSAAHSELSDLIHDMKYHGRPDYAEMMGFMAAQELARSGFFEGIDVLVPVPLTKGRERERGYNQCVSLARGVMSATGIGMATKALKRKSFVQSQTQMTMMDRRENVNGAFRAGDTRQIEGKHVLLIDDVVTTGSTMKACAKALSEMEGLKISVMSLCLARNPFEKVNDELPQDYRWRLGLPEKK